ncbi:MAG: DUF1800 domain-containing protein [Phycisphaeraceae bacterium]
MSVNTSLNRLADDAFGPAEARHLLRRAAFGPEPGQADRLAAMGLPAAVDQFVDDERPAEDDLPQPAVDPDLLRPYTQEERRALQAARRAGDQATLDRFTAERQRRLNRDRAMFRGLQEWWLDVMLRTPRPLHENLALLWHSHFATRHRNVRNTYHMFQQNALFRTHAIGSFARLVRGIVRDPAMLRFLNNDRNRRSQPNENLARELMELFTLGEGNYAEHDIREAARALTGYHVEHNDFRFNQRQHDHGPKAILGRRDRFNGDELATHLLRRNACAQFVAFKLYRHFVADVTLDRITPAQASVVRQLGALVRQSDYRIAPVLKALFESQHFYDASVVGQRIKSPVQMLVGTVRMTGCPARQPRLWRIAMDQLGQTLFDPPSVAGWDGGRSWVNTSTLFTRQNLCLYLLTGHSAAGPRNRDHEPFDPTPLVADLPDRSPAAVVNALVNQLVGDHVPAARREPLVRELQRRTDGGGLNAESLTALLVLITTMPEYQLC